MARIATGVRNFRAAQVTADQVDNYQCGPFTQFDGVSDTIDFEPNSATNRYYGDNKVGVVVIDRGPMVLTVSRQSLLPVEEAFLLGKDVDGQAIYEAQGDNPPDVCASYEITYDDGTVEFVFILKTKFADPVKSSATKSDTTEFKPTELVGEGRAADYRRSGRTDLRVYREYVDDETAADAFRASTASGLNLGTAPANTITTDPLEDAIGVVVGIAPTFTSDNAYEPDTVSTDNIQMYKNGTEITPVAITVALDATQKIITVTPSSSLDALSDYTVIMTPAVKTIYNQSAATTLHFTTA